jgi:hypothetical protein
MLKSSLLSHFSLNSFRSNLSCTRTNPRILLKKQFHREQSYIFFEILFTELEGWVQLQLALHESVHILVVAECINNDVEA